MFTKNVFYTLLNYTEEILLLIYYSPYKFNILRRYDVRKYIYKLMYDSNFIVLLTSAEVN